jgi:hypothetical protein
MTAHSQNGWPANDINRTSSRPVPGTNVKLRVVNGAAGDLLLWVAAQFDKRVESIDNAGTLNDWGYAERPIRGGVALSNHASGTAIDLNADHHPLGTAPSKTFSAQQIAEIHEIIEQTGFLVRWGGDYSGRKDPMHFEIDNGVSAAECAARLTKLTAPAKPPVKTATEEDDLTPEQDEKLDLVFQAIWGMGGPGGGAVHDSNGSYRPLLQNAEAVRARVENYINSKSGDDLAEDRGQTPKLNALVAEVATLRAQQSQQTAQLNAIAAGVAQLTGQSG